MKFGIDQIGKDAPEWMNKLADASVVLLGALAIWSLSIPDSFMNPETKNFLGATFTLLVSGVTVFKIITGKSKGEV